MTAAKRRLDRLEDFQLDEANPNRGTERGRDLLARSIEEVGLGRSVLASADGVILAGNQTAKQARASGITRVIPVETDGKSLVVVIRKDLQSTDPLAMRVKVLDNRASELGLAWDPERLAEIAAQVDGLVGGEVPVFTEGEWARVRSLLEAPPLVPGSTEPPPPEEPASGEGLLAHAAELHRKWKTATGQVWQIGGDGHEPHRILCGDCRDEKATARLFAGEPAPLVLADPPYCSGGFQEAGRSAGTFGKIASDQLSTRGFSALMTAMLTAAKPRAAYLFIDWRMWIPLYDLVESSGLPVRSMIVWDKGTPGLGSLWRTQHELVMFGSRDGKKREKGIAAYGNVIRCQRTGNQHHYTEKPVDLLARLLEGDAASPRGACPVYDPFMGSGSILFAAERLKRQAFCCEVEPKWVAIALERAALIGLEPRLGK